MSDNVKIHEIAKTVGISSGELIEICQKAGYSHIKHHSNAVPRDEADEIRKTAIKLYKPKTVPVPKAKPKPAPPKKTEKAKAPAPAQKEPVPLTKDVKPVPPPKPRGARRPPDEAEEEEDEGTKQAVSTKRRRRRPPRKPEDGEHITTRTIVFKQQRRVPEKKREEKVEMMRPVSVRGLSERLGETVSDIIKKLMFSHGVRANINEVLDDELIELLGLDYGVEITLTEPKSAEDVLLESLPEDSPEDLVPRPPVIALLGHVDHGKTSILDHIRNTHVAESEAGGITQDIGAWQAQVDGHPLTFIDTPGHEAFTAMRARGARVTDVVVLVVAADDGVMPQTVEAIDHARAAEVPIVVAINKVDKPDASAMRVRQQLAGQGLNPEDWGGDVGCVELSALTGQGVDDLLERITLEAELLETKANPNRGATGVALEARILPGRGAVTNVIVQNGTLRKGDIVACGNAYGTARALYNDRGEQVDQAGPSQPVAISGLNRVPEAGDTFLVVDDLEIARNAAQERQRALEVMRRRPRRHVTLENLFESLQRGETRQLNVIVKADVQGSLEPLVNSLVELGNEEVSVRIIHSGVGKINRSDVLLADASDAIILAYRVAVDDKVQEMAASSGIEIARFDVIYNVIDQVHAALEGLLEPGEKEEHVGWAEVRQTFHISRYGTVAGCYVTEGAMRRNCRVRVLRDGRPIHEGAMASLRQEKNDVREVQANRECGINMQGFDDLEIGDRMECFTVVEVKRTLSTRAAGQPVQPGSGAGPSAER